MKAILKFDLSDPDDKENYKITNKALDYYCAIGHIQQELRAIEKWSEDSGEMKYEKLKNIIYDTIDDYELPKD